MQACVKVSPTTSLCEILFIISHMQTARMQLSHHTAM